MPGPATTLLIEGTFEELADELAQYIDSLKKAQGDESSSLQTECAAHLQENQKDEVLKKLVTGSQTLNQAPEKEFIAAYNLLIHLVRQSPNLTMFLPRICGHLSSPITSSPANGAGLALSVLGTVFNTLPSEHSEMRYHILLAVLRVIRATSNFETLRPQLKQLDTWLEDWDMEEAEDRKLYLAVSDVATDAGEDEQAYIYLLRALRTFPTEEVSSKEAHELSLRALKSALTHPSHFDFQDLTSLDSIQALRTSDPIYFQLLEIFNSDLLDDFNDFKDEHDGWVEKIQLDGAVLNRKMRLLTLASLAASTQSRSLPYSKIAAALQVPSEDVEMWVIDVIRAGLVEGKLSQLDQTFLIHRSTYRVFGENQWREVDSRLNMWKNSLQGVLQVIQAEKQKLVQEKEEEASRAEQRFDQNQRGRGGMGMGAKAKLRPMIDDDMD